jgi:hypothetical protein
MFERLFTPRKGELGPLSERIVERLGDSGGGWYRPPFRGQNPTTDPQEPYGSESSDTGYDHGWANCTMSAGAMVLAFHTLGKTDKWGGHLRHAQTDLSGGTDLYDLRDAWGAYGQALDIRSGGGWDGVEADREKGCAIVLQGEGGTPGAGTYTGGHAVAVLPETHSDGRWLLGNPECNGYEWVSSSALREWAQRWSSGVSWARSAAHPPGGEELPAVQLTMTEPYSGTATVEGSGHKWIRIYDSFFGDAADGFTKEVFARAKLKKSVTSPGGTVIPAGTDVVLIGDDLAVFLEQDVTLEPSGSDDFIPAPAMYIRKT